MRILRADDHSLVREATAAFLRGEGFADITGVDSLDEAVRAAARTPFGLALLDYDMP